MDWKIFSAGDLKTLVKDAEKFNFEPCGKLNFETFARIARWQGKNYTFAWLAMKKKIAIIVLSERSQVICIITEIDPLLAMIMAFYFKKSKSGCILSAKRI